MADYQGVLAVAEQKKGKVQPVSFEVLGVARRIADELGTQVSAVLLGSQEGQLLAERGANRVLAFSAAELTAFQDGIYANVLAHLVPEVNPEVIVGPATIMGKALFGRLAARLGLGLAADAIDLQVDPGQRTVLITRSVYAGNALAELKVRTTPQLITIRPKIFREAPSTEKRGEVIPMTVPTELYSDNTRWLNSVSELGQSVNLTQADIIVSGGRGLRSPENFSLIRDLAAAFGGAVGASRAVVDAGWIPYAHQVGQTGKTVNPKLYVACGISGAIQHLAGMQGSKCIVAINKDPEAPIFKVATYGIVGDLFEVIPALTQELKKGRE